MNVYTLGTGAPLSYTRATLGILVEAEGATAAHRHVQRQRADPAAARAGQAAQSAPRHPHPPPR
ncbi:MAG: hypothetical protein R2911_20050 [Caldilineaceae bacterium]